METYTFLFTDIEGSTALLRRLGQCAYEQMFDDHLALIRSALPAHGGSEANTLGDGFFAAFSSVRACVAAVLEMQQAIVPGRLGSRSGRGWASIPVRRRRRPPA